MLAQISMTFAITGCRLGISGTDYAEPPEASNGKFMFLKALWRHAIPLDGNASYGTTRTPCDRVAGFQAILRRKENGLHSHERFRIDGPKKSL